MRHCLSLAIVATFGVSSFVSAADPAKDALVSSEKMLGASIYNAQEEAIADINTVIINKQGEPQFVIAGVGGVVGVGETEVAIPWSALKCECKVSDNEKTCHTSVSMSQEQLSKAPALKAENYAELSDKDWLASNAKYFSSDAPETVMKSSEMVCVATVIENPVYVAKDKSVGYLDAIMFDVAQGKALYAIIGDGGTAGVGLNQQYIAVPFSSLQFSHMQDDEIRVTITESEADLKDAPKVTPSEYPELDLESVRNRITTSS